MFKKDLPISTNRTNIKSSAQRGLKSTLSNTYPLLKPNIDTIVPSKSKLEAMKVPGGKSVLYTLDSDPLFFSFDQPTGGQILLPHLRLVHRYPECFPSIRVDRGAIPFVLRGAALMAPGFTSKGGRLPEPEERGEGEDGTDEEGRWSRELEKGEPVVVTAEGKEEACAVGVLVAGTKEIKQSRKGQVIDETHFLGDGLWKVEG
ncbi:Translation machinery-associated protein 20 [Zalerion maritima]|uniref:Translation machinery-associated protein 20 n=1 Tax=Zalerion maritima TaxID=339359 RepID=A0AAD5RTS8_9PEZI|nr:Translation machinery-associated protein 20 [Zalerion maritima]